MLRRGQGKVNFLELRDWTGRIQVFVGKKQVGELGWKLAELLDLGDLIGVDGRLGYTRTGELTVFAESLDLPGQEPAAAAREVARPDRPGTALPPALRRPVQQPRVAGRLPGPVEADRLVPQDHGRAGVRRGRDAHDAGDRRRARRPGRSSPITTRSTSTCSCGSPPSCTSSGSWSAAWSGSSRSAGSIATRGSARGTTPSSPCSRPTRPTATTTR